MHTHKLLDRQTFMYESTYLSIQQSFTVFLSISPSSPPLSIFLYLSVYVSLLICQWMMLTKKKISNKKKPATKKSQNEESERKTAREIESDIETWNTFHWTHHHQNYRNRSKTIITKTLWNEEECEKLFDMIRNLILIYLPPCCVFVSICICPHGQAHTRQNVFVYARACTRVLRSIVSLFRSAPNQKKNKKQMF